MIIPNEQDKRFMQHALDLARNTLSQTSPNPSVGAVVVRDGVIVGIGAHLKAGTPHAEIHALNMAQDQAAGATMYITLEPCNHHGKTPPCVDAIIRAKIATVFVATLDKNPQMCETSVEALMQHGVSVHVGLLEEMAIEINKMFFHYIVHKMPYVTLKAGVSMDGKIATYTTQSQWITNKLSRMDAHGYRATHDAVLVGINTVLHDNPSLTPHLLGNNVRSPLRVVLDTHLRTPEHSCVVADGNALTIIVTGRNIDRAKAQSYEAYKHVTVVSLDTDHVEIPEMLTVLSDRFGVSSLLVEGGNAVYTSFLEHKLVNQLVLYMAPILIGGNSPYHFFGGVGFDKLADAIGLTFIESSTLGDNIKLVAQVL